MTVTMNLEKPEGILLRDAVLKLPSFFPSISSIKTNLPVLDYLRALAAIDAPLFLISAYDIFQSPNKDEILSLLNDAHSSGKTVLLDSGNYESYWMKDLSWDKEKFREILECCPCSLAFHYDNQQPSSNKDEVVIDIEKQFLENQEYSSQVSIIPIIHAQGVDDLPYISREVVTRLFPLGIAIPERILGDGIIARAKNLRKIRTSIDEAGIYTPIHLLGTGNPLSLLLYILAGADTFDGLEWCQTVVNHKDGLLYHLQQYDLFQDQTTFGDTELPFIYKALTHNLTFYFSWISQLQQAKDTDELLSIGNELFAEKFNRLPLKEIL